MQEIDVLVITARVDKGQHFLVLSMQTVGLCLDRIGSSIEALYIGKQGLMLGLQFLHLLALGGDESMRLGIVTFISPSLTCVVASLEGNGRLDAILPEPLIVLIILAWVLILL